MTRKVICLLVLALLGSAVVAQSGTQLPDWCGKYESTADKSQCDTQVGCVKCSECKGGRISRGFRPTEKVAEEVKDHGGDPRDYPAPYCVSIWAWLGPLLAVIVIGGGVGAFFFMRKRNASAQTAGTPAQAQK